jgi:hypothetical protein
VLAGTGQGWNCERLICLIRGERRQCVETDSRALPVDPDAADALKAQSTEKSGLMRIYHIASGGGSGTMGSSAEGVSFNT